MTTRRQFVQVTAGAAALGSLTSFPSFAQALDLVKIINGFPAGGTADATSRRVGDLDHTSDNSLICLPPCGPGFSS